MEQGGGRGRGPTPTAPLSPTEAHADGVTASDVLLSSGLDLEIDEEEGEDGGEDEGLPAADDVLDLIVLDVDDDDLDGDEEGDVADRTRPPQPVAVRAATDTATAAEMEEVAARAAVTAAPAAPAEYYRGLGKRLEPFAPLAVPVDPNNQIFIRERITVIERFRAENAAQVGEGADAVALAARDSGPPFCRICRDAEGEGPGLGLGLGTVTETSSLVSPCECRGSVARVHIGCLERWLAESDSTCCELCGHRYTTVRTPSYNVLVSIPAWMFHTGSTDLFFDLVAFMIFTPVALFGTHLGINADDSAYFQVTLMAAIDLVYSAWLAMRLHYHAIHWYSWWRRKSTVKVILDTVEQKDRLADS